MRLTATFQHPVPRQDLLLRLMPTVRERQGFFRRVLNAIIRSRQIRADREIREILMRHGLTRRATIEAHEFRPTRCRFSDQG